MSKIPPAISHLFSVDVEEYFHVSAFERVVPRDAWSSYPTRVGQSIDVILDLLARNQAKGTFFTLGWVATRQPDLVKKIAAAGHEIASHGWSHERVTTLTPAQFRNDIRTTKDLLEDLTGQRVLGYRAPSFSIVPRCDWALDVLVEEGYVYDSSLFPIRRANYGNPDTPPVAHVIERQSGPLFEFPPATIRWNSVRIPAAGGAYIRHFPYAVIRRAFREHSSSGVPGMFYIHPWEVDPEQPRMPVPLLTRVRHYRGLNRTVDRLERLLTEFRFTAVREALAHVFPESDEGDGSVVSPIMPRPKQGPQQGPPAISMEVEVYHGPTRAAGGA